MAIIVTPSPATVIIENHITIVITIREDGNGFYSTLASAISSEASDLVAARRSLVFEISGTWTSAETSAINVIGYTTDATSFITITTTGSSRHSGTYDTNAWRIELSVAGDGTELLISEPYTVVDGIQASLTYSGSGGYGLIWANQQNGIIIENCIARGSGGTGTRGIRVWSDIVTDCVVRNNLVYDCGLAGIYTIGVDVEVVNNTIENCPTGIDSGYADTKARNNIIWNASTEELFNTYVNGSGENFTDGAGMDYDDCGASCGTGDEVSQSDPFTNLTGADYSLSSSHPGVDLSADFTTDAIGTTRSAWDKGWMEFVDSSVTVTPSVVSVIVNTQDPIVVNDVDIVPTNVNVIIETQDPVFVHTISVKEDGTGNYTSLDAAFISESGANLISLKKIIIFEISGIWNNEETATSTNITNINVNDTYYFIVRCVGEARHSGVWSNKAYRITDNVGSFTIAFNTPKIKVDGLQIEWAGDALFSTGLESDFGLSDVTIASNCIITYTGAGTLGAQAGLVGHPNGNLFAYNNIIYGFKSNTSGRGIVVGSQVDASYIYNNTISDCDDGIIPNGSGTISIIKNNIIYNCSVIRISGTYGAGSDYNATDAASLGYTVTGGGNVNDRLNRNVSSSAPFYFVSSAQSDYRLDIELDTAAFDMGVDLSADTGFAFSDEIGGETRTIPWAIGASEPTVLFLSDVVDSIVNTQDPTTNISGGGVSVTPSPSTVIVNTQDPTIVNDVNILPSVVSVIISTIDPTVIITGGNITITPSAATVIIKTQDPTIFNNVVFSPSVVSVIVKIENPTIVNNIIISPTVIDVIVNTQDPSIINNVTFSASALSVIVNTQDPTINEGATIAPSIISVIINTQSPTVVNIVSLIPSSLAVILAVAEPTVIITGGNVTITPTISTVIIETVDPIAIQGPITFIPSVVSLIVATLDPSISITDVLVAPAAITTIVETQDPVVVLGSILFTPTLISVITQTINPITIGGNINVFPIAISTIVSSIDPTVILGSVLVSPTFVNTIVSVVNPIVESNISVIPAVITTIISSIDPISILGSIVISPTFINIITSSQIGVVLDGTEIQVIGILNNTVTIVVQLKIINTIIKI